MITLTRQSLDSLTTMCCFSLLICAFICSNVYSAPTDKATYQEIKKDGRIYVFTSLIRMEDFEKSGELGKGIIKIGYGENGETVVFDSEEAVYDYDSKQVKQILDRMRIRAYKEFEKDGRIYVFTSPRRKASFDKSGEMGKDFIAKIGCGPNGKTVLFDSVQFPLLPPCCQQSLRFSVGFFRRPKPPCRPMPDVFLTRRSVCLARCG